MARPIAPAREHLAAEALREWRLAHGWTQAAAGARFGYAGSTVGSWETGRWPVPPDVAAYVADHPAPAEPAVRSPVALDAAILAALAYGGLSAGVLCRQLGLAWRDYPYLRGRLKVLARTGAVRRLTAPGAWPVWERGA